MSSLVAAQVWQDERLHIKFVVLHAIGKNPEDKKGCTLSQRENELSIINKPHFLTDLRVNWYYTRISR